MAELPELKRWLETQSDPSGLALPGLWGDPFLLSRHALCRRVRELALATGIRFNQESEVHRL